MKEETSRLAQELIKVIDDLPILENVLDQIERLDKSEIMEIIQFMTGSLSKCRENLMKERNMEIGK